MGPPAAGSRAHCRHRRSGPEYRRAVGARRAQPHPGLGGGEPARDWRWPAGGDRRRSGGRDGIRDALVDAPGGQEGRGERPRATVERDKTGELPLRHLFEPAAHGSNGASASAAGEPSSFASGPDGAVAAAAREHKASPMEIAVGEFVVKNGRVTWRDDMVNPRSALDFAGIDVAVTGASWPVRGPLTVRASAQPPTAVRSASPGASGSIPSQPTSASRARGRDCALPVLSPNPCADRWARRPRFGSSAPAAVRGPCGGAR